MCPRAAFRLFSFWGGKPFFIEKFWLGEIDQSCEVFSAERNDQMLEISNALLSTLHADSGNARDTMGRILIFVIIAVH